MRLAFLMAPLLLIAIPAQAQAPERRSNMDGLYGRSPEFQNRQGPTELQRRGGAGAMYDENGRLRADRRQQLDQHLDRTYGPGAAAQSRRYEEQRERDLRR